MVKLVSAAKGCALIGLASALALAGSHKAQAYDRLESDAFIDGKVESINRTNMLGMTCRAKAPGVICDQTATGVKTAVVFLPAKPDGAALDRACGLYAGTQRTVSNWSEDKSYVVAGCFVNPLATREVDTAALREALMPPEFDADQIPPKQAASSPPSHSVSTIELDALRARLMALWTPPAGAKTPEELMVTVRIKLNVDGTVEGVPMVINSGTSPFFMAAQESALRAVFRAQPFNMLNPASYESWKDIEITFDPRYAAK